jgi:hypothetical protein
VDKTIDLGTSAYGCYGLLNEDLASLRVGHIEALDFDASKTYAHEALALESVGCCHDAKLEPAKGSHKRGAGC